MKIFKHIALSLSFIIFTAFIPMIDAQAYEAPKISYASAEITPIKFGTEIKEGFGLLLNKPRAYTFSSPVPGFISLKLDSDNIDIKGQLIKLVAPGDVDNTNNKVLQTIDLSNPDKSADFKNITLPLEKGDYAFVVSGPAFSNYSLKADFSSNLLPLNEEINGSLEQANPKDDYIIRLDKPGTLILTATSEITPTVISLKNSDNEMDEILLINGTQGNPSQKSFTANLDKGDYTLTVTTKGILTTPEGKYSIKTEFSPVSVNVNEPNNSIEDAQKIDLDNPIHGFFTSNNSSDVFKFTLNSERKISLDFESYIKTSSIEIKDDNQRIVWASVASGDKDTSSSKNFEKKLSPGTYYVFVNSKLNFTGKYNLSIKDKGSWDDILEFNKTIDGELNLYNNENTYKTYIEKSSHVSFNIKTYITGTIVEIKDQNRKSLYKTIINGGETNPVSKDVEVDLNKGLYYLCISTPVSLKNGRYSIKATMDSTDINEVEPNDNINSAQKISEDNCTINGFLAANDDEDIYMLNLTKKGKLNLDFKSYMNNVIIELKDSKSNSLLKKVLSASYDEPKNENYSADLENGIYYLHVRKHLLDSTGKYTFKTSFTSNDKINVIEPNDDFSTAQSLELPLPKPYSRDKDTHPLNEAKNTIFGCISLTNEKDVFEFSTPHDTTLTLSSNIKSANIEIFVQPHGPFEKSVEYTGSFQGSETEPGIKTIKLRGLNRSSYYIVISKQYTYTGNYSLTVNPNKGWIKNPDSSYSYILDDGNYANSQWVWYDAYYYHFNANSIMETGWVADGGKWYFCDSDGVMQQGWVSCKDKWYFCDNNGVMLTYWINYGGHWYFADSSGAMLTGWVKVLNKWYFFNSSCAMESGWINLNGTWYYLNSSGAMESGWIKLDGAWYFLDDSGAMKTGWHKLSGKWYFFYSNGVMAHDVAIDGYHIGHDGVML